MLSSPFYWYFVAFMFGIGSIAGAEPNTATVIMFVALAVIAVLDALREQ